MAAAKEISVDAATAAALSEQEALSHLKNNKEWHWGRGRGLSEDKTGSLQSQLEVKGSDKHLGMY